MTPHTGGMSRNDALRAARLRVGWRSAEAAADGLQAHGQRLLDDAHFTVSARTWRRWEGPRPGWPSEETAVVLHDALGRWPEDPGAGGARRDHGDAAGERVSGDVAAAVGGLSGVGATGGGRAARAALAAPRRGGGLRRQDRGVVGQAGSAAGATGGTTGRGATGYAAGRAAGERRSGTGARASTRTLARSLTRSLARACPRAAQ